VVPELRTVVVNLVNTDRQGGRRLSDDEVDRVFAGILAARTRP
jgi:hypothetical protein